MTTNNLPDFKARAQEIYAQMRGYSALSNGSIPPIFENKDFKESSLDFIELSLYNQYLSGVVNGQNQGLERAMIQISETEKSKD